MQSLKWQATSGVMVTPPPVSPWSRLAAIHRVQIPKHSPVAFAFIEERVHDNHMTA
jgi:hypothetical protein